MKESPKNRRSPKIGTISGKDGFYRVGKDTHGRWWLLRPDGQPFIYKGCCAICDGIKGNRYWETYQRMYGNDPAKFCRDVHGILSDLGFNAFGMWSFLRTPDAGYDKIGWPYVEYVHAREVYPAGTVNGSCLCTIDAFDPAWERAFDLAAAEKCARHRDNPNLLGYFTDNEPFWGQVWQKSNPGDQMPEEFQGKTWIEQSPDRPHRWGVDPAPGGKGGSLLQVFLTLPRERPGHGAAWDFVLKRHGGSIGQLAKDWGVEMTSPEDLRRRSDEGLILNTKSYGDDHDAFTRLYVETYFRVTGTAIRRHDPNHLRLGVRHVSGWLVHGEAALSMYNKVREYVDVFSVNCYRFESRDAMAVYARYMDMPTLIGEFSWGGWIWDGQTYPEEWKNDHRGWLRQEGCRRLAEVIALPHIVGYTWFKWYCDDVDPDAPAYAVVTGNMEVNRLNAAMFRHVHPQLESVHSGSLLERMSE